MDRLLLDAWARINADPEIWFVFYAQGVKAFGIGPDLGPASHARRGSRSRRPDFGRAVIVDVLKTGSSVQMLAGYIAPSRPMDLIYSLRQPFQTRLTILLKSSVGASSARRSKSRRPV